MLFCISKSSDTWAVRRIGKLDHFFVQNLRLPNTVYYRWSYEDPSSCGVEAGHLFICFFDGGLWNNTSTTFANIVRSLGAPSGDIDDESACWHRSKACCCAYLASSASPFILTLIHQSQTSKLLAGVASNSENHIQAIVIPHQDTDALYVISRHKFNDCGKETLYRSYSRLSSRPKSKAYARHYFTCASHRYKSVAVCETG